MCRLATKTYLWFRTRNFGFFTGVLGAALHRGTEEPQLAPNQQTGLRLVCNLCKHLPLRQWLQTHSAALIDRFAPCCSSNNKAVRFAFATFMLNLSVFFSTAAKADAEGQAQVGSLWLLQLHLLHLHLLHLDPPDCVLPAQHTPVMMLACPMCSVCMYIDASLHWFSLLSGQRRTWISQALSALSELLTAAPPEEMDTLYRYRYTVQSNLRAPQTGLALRRLHTSPSITRT